MPYHNGDMNSDIIDLYEEAFGHPSSKDCKYLSIFMTPYRHLPDDIDDALSEYIDKEQIEMYGKGPYDFVIVTESGQMTLGFDSLRY